jgi:general secretion pathway protein G
MRKGFTMIELIFVIVILGILAAVAIPKLTATRDDAQVAKGLSEVSMAIRDMGAYYTARGDFNATNLGDMTNVTLDQDNGSATGNYDYAYHYETNGNDCVLIELEDDNGTIQVSNAGATDAVCTGITGSAQWTNDLNGTHTFGGSSIFN